MSSTHQQLSVLCDSAFDAIVAITTEGLIVQWNRAAETVFEWKKEEVLGQKLWDIIFPEQDSFSHQQHFHHFLKTGSCSLLSKRTKLRGRKKNNQEFPLEISLSKIEPEGKLVLYLFIRDITELERRDTEQRVQLKKNESNATLLNAFMENVPLGITLLREPNLTLEFINPVAQSLSPFPVEMGKPLFQHAPLEISTPLSEAYERVLTTGKSLFLPDWTIPQAFPQNPLHLDTETKETHNTTPSTQKRTCTQMGVQVGLPHGKTGLLVIFQETTDKIRQREELEERIRAGYNELKKASSFADTILENVPNMIFVKDANQLKFIRFNKAGEDLIGYPRKELIGKNDYDFFPEKQAAFFTAKDREVLAGKALLDIPEEPIETRYKGKRILHTKKVPLYDEKGNPEFLMGISEDITEKKQAEQAHRKWMEEKFARSESERALTLRDEFISIAAHELKTPLTALKMQVDLLIRLLSEMEPGKFGIFRTLLSSSREQLDRFSRLVEDLLDVSRARAGRMLLSKKQEDLCEITQRVVQRLEIEIARSGCNFALNLKSPATGNWDALRIEQILVNLLTNAMKYGAGKPIEISVWTEGPTGTITVKDHGIGISKKDQKRIFDRFERAVSTKIFGGLGLGLFIVHEIVVAHGGTIYVQSELGKGSTFKVELPR